MRRVWRVVLFSLTACGRIGFDDAPEDASAEPLPAIAACGVTTLVSDELSDGVAGPAFTSMEEPGLFLIERDGGVEIEFSPSVVAGRYSFYDTATAYPADGLCATIEVTEVPVNEGAAYFKFRTPQRELELYTYGGLLELRTQTTGTPTILASIPFELATMRFWRLRHQGGTAFWETSPDGTTFVERASLAGFFTANSCTVQFGAGAHTGVFDGGTARFARAIVESS